MWYNLKNDNERQQFMKSAMRLINERSAMVELKNKKPRSMCSNKYLHVILSYFALQIGESLEDVKTLVYKQECNRDLFVRFRYSNLLKKQMSFLRSTSDLSQEEMNLSIERFRMFSSKVAGIYIPSGDEHYKLFEIQHDIEHNFIRT